MREHAEIHRGDAEYGDARKLYNGMIDMRPLMIARCVDVADVMTAVNFGRDQGLRIAIRGGGHNGPGLARSQIQAPAEAPDVEILPWFTGRSGEVPVVFRYNGKDRNALLQSAPIRIRPTGPHRRTPVGYDLQRSSWSTSTGFSAIDLGASIVAFNLGNPDRSTPWRRWRGATVVLHCLDLPTIDACADHLRRRERLATTDFRQLRMRI